MRYAFLLQFIAAIPFLWFATITGKQHVQLLLKGANATGSIISVVRVRADRDSTSYEPVVSFSVGNDEFRFQEWKGTKTAPGIGARVPVLYDPSDPEVAMVDRGYLNYLPWVPFGAIGLFLFSVAIKGLLTLLFRR